ncbi:flagellar basal body-associated FliL family protein [Paraconexibacter antarcticus]|uniref:Flagellar protein FliL n=1 Tax=Paraconexibacter antarcticus TaxID=2949664 RepID=A0ABY5DV12_9ACTN|nr:flagellar basal body-associated FliL family protein [Paraconexibacter antarcticus]UTI64682.1 flagellar basal body-associated FliL family protein [Paraconexibacter antarcticus]
MKSKLKFIIPLLLIAGGAGYKFVLAKPAEAKPAKIAGEIYVLPKDFLLNLADGKFAKLDVALIFKPGFSAAPAAGGEAAAAPPEGYGLLKQEPVVRAIVTDIVTNAGAKDLTSRKGRDSVKQRILKRIDKETDVPVKDVLLTDIAVQ